MTTRKIADVTNKAPTPPLPSQDEVRHNRATAFAAAQDNGAVNIEVDGRVVTMGPPRGGTMRQIAMLIGNENQGNVMMLVMWLKAMMYVRAIDGMPVHPISDMIAAQKIADQLGDKGEEMVMAAYEHYWPMPTKEELPTVKK